MKIELEDISHGKERKDWTYDHDCTLKVKRTDDSGSVTENEEYGYIVQGKDMIFLNSQNVYLPNLPTERQDIAGAFEEVLGKLQDGEGGDDWQPPEWWIPVPEPEEYEIYILVNVRGASEISMILTDTNLSGGEGIIECDWGDGTKEALTGNALLLHNYDSEGQFLIHIICNDKNNFISSLSEHATGVNYLIIKTGSEIFWVNKRKAAFTDTEALYALKSLTILNKDGIKSINDLGEEVVVSFRSMRVLQDFKCPKMVISNLNASNGFLMGASARNMTNILKNFDLTECTSIKRIGKFDSSRGLYNNVNLKEMYLPNCEYIDAWSFGYCMNLKKIIAPKCTYVGDRAFSDCYNLEEVQFAENCVFDGYNCFWECRSLYPRPDGSTN